MFTPGTRSHSAGGRPNCQAFVEVGAGKTCPRLSDNRAAVSIEGAHVQLKTVWIGDEQSERRRQAHLASSVAASDEDRVDQRPVAGSPWRKRPRGAMAGVLSHDWPGATASYVVLV